MLYGTVSTGFKTGGYSNTTDCGAIPFKPEDLRAWELGSKNRFFNDTLQVNLEAVLLAIRQPADRRGGDLSVRKHGAHSLTTRRAPTSKVATWMSPGGRRASIPSR